MEITVSANTTEVSQLLRDLYKDQVPFASARAINRAALAFQKEQRQEMGGRFTLRRKSWAERSIKINRGDFAKKNNLVAIIRVETPGDASRSDILSQHEDGGTKKPKGRHLAIPDEAKRTGAGIVRRDQRPKAFNFQATSNPKIWKGDKRTFLVLNNKGGGVILQRQGRKTPKRGRTRENQGRNLVSDVRTRQVRDTNIRVLYRFATKADLDKRLEFVSTAEKVVPPAFLKAFPEEFAAAIRSAR